MDAIKALDSYRVVLGRVAEHLELVEIQQSRCEKTTSCAQTQAGWTGEYVGKAKQKGQGEITTSSLELLRHPERVMHIPDIQQGTKNPKACEDALVALVTQKEALETARREADRIFNSLLRCISLLEDQEQRRILSLRHLRLLSFKEIAGRLNYSKSSISRKYHESVQAFSKLFENLGQMEPMERMEQMERP